MEQAQEATLETHIVQRAVVFDDLRVLYVPVPKAGCTAILWSLAELSGLDRNNFLDSLGREVSRSLTIHDMGRWPESFRFGSLPPERQKELLVAEDWMRFTVVRHPFRRLWSAWQSKILLGEPQFIEKFAAEPWYPGSVTSATEIFKMFRQFVQAFHENRELARADVHWTPQVELIGHPEVSYDHIGRVERMGETVELLRDHVRVVGGGDLPQLQRENVTPLRYVDELFEEADAKVLGEVYAEDMREFDYESPPKDALLAPVPQEWLDAVDTVAPAVAELRHRNERVGDIQLLFNEKRVELNDRINYMRERIGEQRSRIEDQKRRNDEARRRNEQLAKLRREQQERNERLQKRLREATLDLKRLRSSLSWRVTAPLRKASRLMGRKRRKRA